MRSPGTEAAERHDGGQGDVVQVQQHVLELLPAEHHDHRAGRPVGWAGDGRVNGRTGPTDEIGAPVRSNRTTTRDRARREAATMKLTTMTQVTVDGVMQGNGGASDEDRRNGFERGGWALGVGDDETMTFIEQTYQRADAFLFGRRT